MDSLNCRLIPEADKFVVDLFGLGFLSPRRSLVKANRVFSFLAPGFVCDKQGEQDGTQAAAGEYRESGDQGPIGRYKSGHRRNIIDDGELDIKNKNSEQKDKKRSSTRMKLK